jgi:hypothetical protein
MGDGELRVRSKSRTQEGSGPRKLIGRCAQSIGVVQYQNGSAESPGFAGFVGESRWCLRAPARNFAGLAALQTGEGKGKHRGGRRLLIGEARGRNGRALFGIKRREELLRGGNGPSVVSGWRWVMTGGSHLSVAEREG